MSGEGVGGRGCDGIYKNFPIWNFFTGDFIRYVITTTTTTASSFSYMEFIRLLLERKILKLTLC